MKMKEKSHSIDRREAIKRTSLLLGYAVSASAVTAVMNGCTADTGGSVSNGTGNGAQGSWEPQFFSDQEIDILAELSETILPATQTPGAKDALVHRFMDQALHAYSTPRDQQAIKRGIADLEANALAEHGQGFASISAEQRHAMVETLEQQTAQQMMERKPSPGSQPFYAMVKGMTFLGYFTSELVGENVLSYDPLPEEYVGCVPVSDIGNTWSL